MLQYIYVAAVIGGLVITHRLSERVRNIFIGCALGALVILSIADPSAFPGGSGDWP